MGQYYTNTAEILIRPHCRLRPYIEPLLLEKHLSLKEITFVGIPREDGGSCCMERISLPSSGALEPGWVADAVGLCLFLNRFPPILNDVPPPSPR